MRRETTLSNRDDSKTKFKVVVVGPTCSRGGITSVISAHSQMEAWQKFGCEKLNTFNDGGPVTKFLAATRAYLTAPVVFSGCSIVHLHIAGRSSMVRKLPLLLLAKLMRKRTLVHVHAPSMAALSGSRPKWLFPLICRFADRLVALSAWWAQQFVANGVWTPVSVIPNPIAVQERPALNDEASAQKVLFVGKLEPRKGYADLIRAAATVLASAPETEFVLVGHGEIEEARALSHQLGIQKSITFTGWQSGEALANLYRTATVFCLPSHDEGLPMSVLEAMTWSLPIVTTPVGGIPDIIVDDVNGVFVRPGQISELASRITSLLRQPPEERSRLGSAARERVLQECELTQVSQKLSRVYEDLLCQHPDLITTKQQVRPQ